MQRMHSVLQAKEKQRIIKDQVKEAIRAAQHDM